MNGVLTANNWDSLSSQQKEMIELLPEIPVHRWIIWDGTKELTCSFGNNTDRPPGIRIVQEGNIFYHKSDDPFQPTPAVSLEEAKKLYKEFVKLANFK